MAAAPARETAAAAVVALRACVMATIPLVIAGGGGGGGGWSRSADPRPGEAAAAVVSRGMTGQNTSAWGPAGAAEARSPLAAPEGSRRRQRDGHRRHRGHRGRRWNRRQRPTRRTGGGGGRRLLRGRRRRRGHGRHRGRRRRLVVHRARRDEVVHQQGSTFGRFGNHFLVIGWADFRCLVAVGTTGTRRSTRYDAVRERCRLSIF